jgi:hypothetical protein
MELREKMAPNTERKKAERGKTKKWSAERKEMREKLKRKKDGRENIIV